MVKFFVCLIVEIFFVCFSFFLYNEDGKEDGDLLIRLVDMKKRIFLNFLKQASYPDVNNCLALLYRFQFIQLISEQGQFVLLKVLNKSPLHHFLFVSLHQIRV